LKTQISERQLEIMPAQSNEVDGLCVNVRPQHIQDLARQSGASPSVYHQFCVLASRRQARLTWRR
jgi:hypothetical protein